ncbi:MAG: polymerase, sigma-24 subunit, subfamily [Thermoleophilia bacterium]|nr:polymerase, sigma-24 subunit, subfamily [Thermoleophilia bacterium]
MGFVTTVDTPRPAVPDTRDDAMLMRACAGGDRDAFRVVFERHVDAIRRYLVARLGPDVADDAVVETFAAAWSARGKFRTDADSARPWLYGIATIHAQRLRVAEGRWQEAMRAEAQVADGERAAEQRIPGCSPELAHALATLPPSERELLLLVALGDLTVAMAARACGISAVAARMRLHRARRHVTRILDHPTDGATP